MASTTSRRNSSFPCAQCNHVYPFEFSLTNHIKKEHNSNFECYNCGSIAKTAIGLMQHMKLHVKKDNVKEEKNDLGKTSTIIEQKENRVPDNIKEEKNVPRKVSTVAEQNEKHAVKAPVKKAKNFSQQINWDQNEPTIPKGWKISTNYEFKLYLSPTGRFFKSRELAYASMLEEGSHLAEDLHLMKTGEKSDWIESSTIPEGWKINISDGVGKGERFKSPDGIFIFQNRKDACNYMLQKGGYSSKDIDLMSQKTANTKKQTDWLEDDATVPSGWKVKTTEVKLKNGVSKKQMFKINKKVFDSRQAAFAYMVACRTYSSEDLELMKTGVKTKWEDGDESMPKGWKIRTSNNGKIFWFKSPDGKILYSRESAYIYMTKKGGFSDEDLNLMKSGLHNVTQLTKNGGQSKTEMENGDIKPKILWSSGDGKLPNGWKMRITDKKRTIYLSPDRNTLSTLMQCLQFMIKRKYANKDIQLMAKNLLEEGWEVSKNIPKGWYMKKDREGVSFNFLTDEFKLILGVTDALNFMTNSDKYNNIDMEKLLILVKLVSSSSSAQSVKKEKQLHNIPTADIHNTGNKKVDNEKNLIPSQSDSFSDSLTEESIPLIPEIPSLQPSASHKEKQSVNTNTVNSSPKSDLDINASSHKFKINLITAAIFDKTDKYSEQTRPESGEGDISDCQAKAEFDKTNKKSQQTPANDETDNSNSQHSSTSGEADTYDSQSQSDKTNDSEADLTNDSNSKHAVASDETDTFKSQLSDETDIYNSQTKEESDETANNNFQDKASFDKIQFDNIDNTDTYDSQAKIELDEIDNSNTQQKTTFDKSDDHNSKSAKQPDETDIYDTHTLVATSDETNEPNSQTAAGSDINLHPKTVSDETGKYHLQYTKIPETDKHHFQPKEILDETDKHRIQRTEILDQADKPGVQPTEILDQADKPQIQTDKQHVQSKEILDQADKPQIQPTEILKEADNHHLQPTEISDKTDQHQNQPTEIFEKIDKHHIQPKDILDETDELDIQPTGLSDETGKPYPQSAEISNETSDEADKNDEFKSIQSDESNSSDAILSVGNTKETETGEFHFKSISDPDQTCKLNSVSVSSCRENSKPNAIYNETAISGENYISPKIDKIPGSPKQNVLVYNETVLASEINEAPLKDKTPREDKINDTDEFKIKRSPKRKAETDETGYNSKRKAVSDETNTTICDNTDRAIREIATDESTETDKSKMASIKTSVSGHVSFSQPTCEAMEVTDGFNGEKYETKLGNQVHLSRSFCYEFLTDEHETNFVNIINEFKASLANDNEE